MNRSKKIKIISITAVVSFLVILSITAFVLGYKLNKSKSKLMDESATAWKNDKNKATDQWSQVQKAQNIYI